MYPRSPSPQFRDRNWNAEPRNRGGPPFPQQQPPPQQPTQQQSYPEPQRFPSDSHQRNSPSPRRRYSRSPSPYSRSPSPRRRYSRSPSPRRRYNRSPSPRRRYNRSPSPRNHGRYRDNRRFERRRKPKPVLTVEDFEQADSIFIGNLPYRLRESELIDLFAPCGTVKEVFIGRDRHGDSKGYAFVQFESKKQAEDSIKRFDGYSVGNRKLRIGLDPGKNKKIQAFASQNGINTNNSGDNNNSNNNATNNNSTSNSVSNNETTTTTASTSTTTENKQ